MEKEMEKGKEYSDFHGQLVFEGEYLNGKRWNGKGYNFGHLEYELKNGCGKVKEYYCYADNYWNVGQVGD